MNLDDLLSQAEAEGLSSYEAENLILRNAARYPRAAAEISQKRANKSFTVSPEGVNRFTPRSAAQFDIVITRNTNAINSALPFVVFGASDVSNGYRSIVTPGAGIVLTSVRYGENLSQPNAVRFTYTEGANVDTIDITCNQYPYPAFLLGMNTGLFKISKFRLSLTDATATAQLNQGIDYKRRSMFGADWRNSLPVTAAKSPDQFQNVILDIDGSYDMDTETLFQSNIIKHTAALSVTYSMFVEKVVKLNSVGM